jgi:hypothetical protein
MNVFCRSDESATQGGLIECSDEGRS